ncbi:MAG: hypothetical protein ACOX1H_05540 [Pseudoramibacter sp.]
MDITIQPHPIGGTVQVPPSKSLSHRALICAALADGESVLDHLARLRGHRGDLRRARGLSARKSKN